MTLTTLLSSLLAGCSMEFAPPGTSDCVDEDGDGVCAQLDCDDGDESRWDCLTADDTGSGAGDSQGLDSGPPARDSDEPPLPKDDTSLPDADGDGFADIREGGSDCNDLDPSIHPGAPETWYDGVDQDCDGASDYDADRDLHDAEEYAGDDCDDQDFTVNPGATETWYDGVDQDCDDASDYDADADGHDSEGYAGDDCDDSDSSISPSAAETWYDGVDQDCDDASDYDADADGHDSQDYVGDDCDDSDDSISPSAAEIWYDGVDQDCDGGSDYDADGDGYEADSYAGVDCDDSDPAIYPDALEVLGDGDDQDCDGGADTASLVSLSTLVSTGIEGIRIAENDYGVIVGFLAVDVSGTGTTGTLWHFLDPITPWGGSLGTSGWSYTVSMDLRGGYSLEASGSYVFESYSYRSPTDTNFSLMVNDLAPPATLRESSVLLSDTGMLIGDTQVSFDGSRAGVIFCEENGAGEWLIYLQGTPAEFLTSNTWEYGGSSGLGGNQCGSRVSQQDMLSLNLSSGIERDVSFSSGIPNGTLSTSSTSASSADSLDYALRGSSWVLGEAGPGFVRLSSSSLTVSTSPSSTPSIVRADFDGSDVFAVTVDTSNDAWLYYGSLSGSLTEVYLPSTAPGVKDADVWISSAGALIVAMLGTDNSLQIMALDR